MRGFTIIETLIAVAVLMIAISGPLVIASNGLTAALYAKDQTTASYLAQESMEVIKAIRSNNLSNSPVRNWLAFGVGSGHISDCTSTSPCDVSAVNNGLASIASCSLSGCPLYLSTSGYSDSGAPAQKTIFSRYFYLTGAIGTGSCSPSDNECRVIVTVSWNERTVSQALTLYSQLTNTQL